MKEAITCWSCGERVRPVERDHVHLCPMCDTMVEGQIGEPYVFSTLSKYDPIPRSEYIANGCRFNEELGE